jgi:murein DD-endopeptidase MepM/ murein hydrolase activator NlpD
VVTAVLQTATPSPKPVGPDPTDLRGFLVPIDGACVPDSDLLMPNAPREYRNGVHEGVDFYPGLACATIAYGTPARAMADGVVIRADLDYRDITAEQVATLTAKTAAQGFSDPQTLDIYRGRQVWIDHGNNVVTRYCHLSSIAPGVQVGARVQRGQTVGGIGDSGTPESVVSPRTETHLHAEVRIGDSFLGAGLPPAEVRRLYERLFGS